MSRADPIQVPVICARRNHRPDRPGPAVADTGERPRRRADRSRRPGMPGLAGADRSAPASRAALPRGTLPSPEGRRFHPLSARSAASVGAQRARARQTPASSPIGRHEASVLRPSQPETVRRSESLPAERRLQRAHAGRDGTSSPVTTKCSGLAQLLSPGSVSTPRPDRQTPLDPGGTPGGRAATTVSRQPRDGQRGELCCSVPKPATRRRLHVATRPPQTVAALPRRTTPWAEAMAPRPRCWHMLQASRGGSPPGRAGVGEVDRQPRGQGQGAMAGHLGAGAWTTLARSTVYPTTASSTSSSRCPHDGTSPRFDVGKRGPRRRPARSHPAERRKSRPGEPDRDFPKVFRP